MENGKVSQLVSQSRSEKRQGGLRSNHHLSLFLSPKVYVKDLESSNGTFVDGERVTKPMEIQEGSKLDFGVVVYDDDGETGKHRLDLPSLDLLDLPPPPKHS